MDLGIWILHNFSGNTKEWMQAVSNLILLLSNKNRVQLSTILKEEIELDMVFGIAVQLFFSYFHLHLFVFLLFINHHPAL